MMHRTLLALATTALAGCGKPASEAIAIPDRLIPPIVFQAMGASLPDNGNLRIIRRGGRFVIKPTTLFCNLDLDSGFRMSGWNHGTFNIHGTEIVKLLESLGQKPTLDGSMRQRTVSGGQCPLVDENIFYSAQVSNNKSGKSYKMVLAIWQADPNHGGAIWVGGLERDKGHRPEIVNAPPYRVGPSALAVVSLRLDTLEISKFAVDAM